MAAKKGGKKKGADGKACWSGYRHAGTKGGKDKCVPTGKGKTRGKSTRKKEVMACGACAKAKARRKATLERRRAAERAKARSKAC